MGFTDKTISGIILVAVLSVAVGCVKLPDNFERSTSFALSADDDSPLGTTVSRVLDSAPDDSAYLLLGGGLDALVARMALARAAEKSIDTQYYLLHDDEVGGLFIRELLDAADRGVRVRLLVDDMDMGGRDFGAALLDSHPNVEVRLFNPFSRESGRVVQFITGFGEQTRRAHNKSFTADSIATIIGGRNIGNEYFVADPDTAFIDLDVLAVGPAAELVAGSFDIYWNHELSYPAALFLDAPITADEHDERLAAFIDSVEAQKDSEYVRELQDSKLAQALDSYELELIRGRSLVFWDHPGKLLNYDDDSGYLMRDLRPYLDETLSELFIMSPYFVPGRAGVEFFRELRDRGVRVVVLTNSLASTDVSIVHAGYANYRKQLLELGVELYELNRELKGGDEEKEWTFYHSKASLHAKCFVIDRQKTFIGSLNLDPRSVVQNTEIGMIIESTEIGETIASSIEDKLDRLAFRLELREAPDGLDFLVWHGLVDGEHREFRTEPYTGFSKRFLVGLMRLLPVESQL